MRRRTRLLVLLPVAGLAAVSACAPFHAGAAATVGNDRISTQDLRKIVDRENTEAASFSTSTFGAGLIAQGSASSAPATATVRQQQALAELVQIQVLQHAAGLLHASLPANGIAVARNAIVAQVQAGEEDVRQFAAYQGVDLDTLATEKAWSDAVSAAAEATDDQVKAFVATDDHRVVQVSRVDLSSQSSAQQLVTAAQQQAGLFDQVVSQEQLQTTNAVYTARELQAQVPTANLAQGAVVGPVRINDDDYAVYEITAVKQDSLAVALEKGSVERSVLGEETFDSTYRVSVLQLGVHVSPRFGEWTYPSSDGLGTIGDLSAPSQLSILKTASTTTATTSGS